MMRKKIEWFSILFLVVLVFATGCSGSKNLSPGRFQTINVDITPPSSMTISSFFPSAICFGGNDDKVYIYSKSNRSLYGVSLEILSVFTPDKFKTTYDGREFPSKEYRHQLDDFAVLPNDKIVAYSKEANELVLLSKKGELISRMEGNLKDGVFLVPCRFEDDHFFLVNKGKGKMYIMNTSGKILLDFKVDSQIEEVLYNEGYLYVRISTNQIVRYDVIYYSPKENPERWKYSISEPTALLNGFPLGEILGFTVDVLGDLFVVYHSKKGDKLKIAMVVSNGKKRQLRVFYERPMSEVPHFFKILAYRGFLMVVEGDEELKIAIYPIRQIKEDHKHH